VTGYYIDKQFRYHECLIDFKRLEGQHKGDALATFLLSTLDDMGISSRLFCITSDAASNNIKMGQCLEKMLRDRGIEWIAEERHIFCIDHVINLCVQTFLTSIKVTNAEDGNKKQNDGDDAEDGNKKQNDDDDDDEVDECMTLSLENTLKKLRNLAKVFPVTICNVQRICSILFAI
jgi:hypothetical protein